jgi:hypothetical protein
MELSIHRQPVPPSIEILLEESSGGWKCVCKVQGDTIKHYLLEDCRADRARGEQKHALCISTHWWADQPGLKEGWASPGNVPHEAEQQPQTSWQGHCVGGPQTVDYGSCQ